jgi:four helix bundle protein
MELVTEIYQITRIFPKDERFGLISQLRRAAVSVPSNVAEGYGRNSRNELHHFIGQARGSLCEVETQVELAKNLGFLKEELATELSKKVAEVGRLLTGLRSWSSEKGA